MTYIIPLLETKIQVKLCLVISFGLYRMTININHVEVKSNMAASVKS